MNKLKFIFFYLILFTTLNFTSCDPLELDVEVPSCIEDQIKDIKKEDVRNPPARVVKWEVDGKIYYYISSDCCDQFNFLYDDQCNQICAPDGGITGQGDGKCPDFNGSITKTLVWEDDRG